MPVMVGLGGQKGSHDTYSAVPSVRTAAAAFNGSQGGI